MYTGIKLAVFGEPWNWLWSTDCAVYIDQVFSHEDMKRLRDLATENSSIILDVLISLSNSCPILIRERWFNLV